MNQDPRKAFEHHCKTIGIDGSALERWEEGCENPALAGQYMRNHVELMWRSYLWRTEVAAPQPNAALADGYDDGDSTSREQYRRMFHAACADLGAINEALGLDPDDGGAEPILEAMAELKASALPSGWMPIEAAPKDGSHLLLRSAKGRIADGCWMAATNSVGAWVWAYVKLEPTHWRPLPAPPTLNASKEQA